jgi:hypothetical protein
MSNCVLCNLRPAENGTLYCSVCRPALRKFDVLELQQSLSSVVWAWVIIMAVMFVLNNLKMIKSSTFTFVMFVVSFMAVGQTIYYAAKYQYAKKAK